MDQDTSGEASSNTAVNSPSAPSRTILVDSSVLVDFAGSKERDKVLRGIAKFVPLEAESRHVFSSLLNRHCRTPRI